MPAAKQVVIAVIRALALVQIVPACAAAVAWMAVARPALLQSKQKQNAVTAAKLAVPVVLQAPAVVAVSLSKRLLAAIRKKSLSLSSKSAASNSCRT